MTFYDLSWGATTTLEISTGNVHDVLKGITYKPGWSVGLDTQGLGFTRLRIDARVLDSATEKPFLVTHFFPLPAHASYAWPADAIEDWIFQRILDVERHEAGEFYRVRGQRPYMPDHGPGVDHYNVRRRAHPVP